MRHGDFLRDSKWGDEWNALYFALDKEDRPLNGKTQPTRRETEPAIFVRAVTSASMQIPMMLDEAKRRATACRVLIRSLEEVYRDNGRIDSESECLRGLLQDSTRAW